ncbi:hypothetical protein IEO21_02016 [Rhodonia placenta]|uniref:Isomerase YbhE n=1 Tax=Rhodonia placenta TaxID=104341 RepID=A0A8H7P8G9_9APHY|nr:hypothetical protein IEO21_02016 [Postia placenta]
MPYRILVGSYANEIYTVSFDPDTSSISLVSSITVGYHPSWITPHPTDISLVFAGLEQAEGKIVVVRYDEGGKGSLVGEVPSGGADPCTLLAAGTELLIGNYSSGTFTTIPLIPEPPHLQAAQSSTLRFTGTGPNKERQEASHLHQVFLHPTRAELLIPDLGADVTRRFVKDVSGVHAQMIFSILSSSSRTRSLHIGCHPLRKSLRSSRVCTHCVRPPRVRRGRTCSQRRSWLRRRPRRTCTYRIATTRRLRETRSPSSRSRTLRSLSW